jgi:membrane protease YdiL (CAAX protease family)
MLKWVEKRPVSLDRLGLAARKNGFRLVGLGLVIGLLMYFGYLGIGSLPGETEWVWSPENDSWLPLTLIFLNILVNGFGEETAFRAYLQRAFIHRHGLWWGIGLTSVIFVTLHLLLYDFSILVLAAGILLSGMFGLLTVWTGSIFLSGTMHVIFNLAPRLSGLWPSDLSLLIINGLGFLITAIFYLRSNGGRMLSDRSEQA